MRSPAVSLHRSIVLLQKAAFLLRSHEIREIARRIRCRILDSSEALGLRRDLLLPADVTRPEMPLTIRPACPEDGLRLFARSAGTLSFHERHEYLDRLLLLDAGVQTCYVAVTSEGTPVYIQWAIGAEENDRMHTLFNGWFPRLAPDEILLEYMLTAKEYRGKHVMWWAMSSILRLQQERGKRWAITFIPSENDISVLAHRKLGFHPYTVRRERRLLLTRSLTFTPFF